MTPNRQHHCSNPARNLLSRLAELGDPQLARQIQAEFGGLTLFIPSRGPRNFDELLAASGTGKGSDLPADPSP